jgi:hypothetical protein
VTALLLALALLSLPARAGSWCSGIIAANGDCLITESPVIVRCDYDTSRRDSRCVGVADRRQIFDADTTVTPDTAPRRRREKR